MKKNKWLHRFLSVGIVLLLLLTFAKSSNSVKADDTNEKNIVNGIKFFNVKRDETKGGGVFKIINVKYDEENFSGKSISVLVSNGYTIDLSSVKIGDGWRPNNMQENDGTSRKTVSSITYIKVGEDGTTQVLDLKDVKGFIDSLRIKAPAKVYGTQGKVKNPDTNDYNDHVKVGLMYSVVGAIKYVQTDMANPDKKVPHYYQEIPVPEGISWKDAYNAAKKRTFHGMRGYLATITNSGEQDFIYNNIARIPGWLGGTRGRINGQFLQDSQFINEIPEVQYNNVAYAPWYWADGPEGFGQNSNSSGLGDKPTAPFYKSATYTRGHDYIDTIGYSNWNNQDVEGYNFEPNNQDFHEAFLEFADMETPKWNDLPNDPNNYANKAFYVEYSPYNGQFDDVTAGMVYDDISAPLEVAIKKDDKDELEYTTQEVGWGNIGDPYEFSKEKPFKPEIPGYEFEGVKESTLKGTYSNEVKYVIYYYKKKPDTPRDPTTPEKPKPEPSTPDNATNKWQESKVIVHYQDGEGNAVAPDEVINGHVGDGYISSAKDVSGYILKTRPANATGFFEYLPVEVTYIYVKNTSEAVKPIIPNESNKPGRPVDKHNAGKTVVHNKPNGVKMHNANTKANKENKRAAMPQTGFNEHTKFIMLILGCLVLLTSIAGMFLCISRKD